jgi:hypothetical protein
MIRLAPTCQAAAGAFETLKRGHAFAQLRAPVVHERDGCIGIEPPSAYGARYATTFGERQRLTALR